MMVKIMSVKRKMAYIAPECIKIVTTEKRPLSVNDGKVEALATRRFIQQIREAIRTAEMIRSATFRQDYETIGTRLRN